MPPALAGPPSGHGLDTDPETGAGTGSLITTTSMHGVLDELRQLGAVGPVVALSVGEENAGPALAIGFDLADKLQALGARVLMIDVVLDEPMLHALLGVDITPGLAEVLGGEVPLRNAVRPLPGLDGLHALTVGAATAMTAAALTGPPFERLLRDAKAEYHSILLVAGSVYDTRLVPAMANLVDGLIVGTGLPPGEPASPELAARLAALPAPTLELLSSMLTAEQPQGTASSTPGR